MDNISHLGPETLCWALTSDGEVAHLALDTSLVPSAATGYHPFIEDLVEDGLVEAHMVLRGKWRGRPSVSGG